jgi:hypothetical protein
MNLDPSTAAPTASTEESSLNGKNLKERTNDGVIGDTARDVPIRPSEKKRLYWRDKTCTNDINSLNPSC